jgi:hypothetical protein
MQVKKLISRTAHAPMATVSEHLQIVFRLMASIFESFLSRTRHKSRQHGHAWPFCAGQIRHQAMAFMQPGSIQARPRSLRQSSH